MTDGAARRASGSAGAPGARRPEHGPIDREVLEIVTALVVELGGGASRRPVELDDSLERDLGLGSLERVELLLRLEEAFGVRLADAVMEGAETPRDLVGALLTAAPALPETLPEARAPLGAAAAAPASARTLTEVLRWHAEADPGRVHIFLREDDGEERHITYGALREGAERIAAGLRERGIAAGDRVALMLRTEAAFFSSFFGVLFAGAVPVPIYPPFRADRIEEYARREAGILANAAARLLITFAEAGQVAGILRSRVPSLAGVATVERLALPQSVSTGFSSAADAPALIQYTSGSTGQPKGVLLTHRNLLANIRAIGEAICIGPEDVAVSWLPLYHDMGLIGTWLGALYFGVPIAIMSPLAFLSRPARWLRVLHAHRATMSPAPNFAFELCARRVRDDEIAGVDLSAWRIAFNGSEPVSPDTVERFTRRFAPYGFRAEAMLPVYGMAEASVALTIPPIGREPRIDRVDRETFSRSRAARPAPSADPAPLRFVSCGHPIPGHEVRVVDRTGHPLGERLEGRIEFRGPSVTGGYFRNPELTRAAMRDGWMDSGDLGYWADGELFITGRQKDLIIKGGRNLYPQEVEEVVGDVPGIRKGCVAAFGVPDAETGTERLVVIAESRETANERHEALRAEALRRVVAALGVPADTIVICAPGSILKTSSGKIRRGATRDAFVHGELGRPRRSARVQWLRLLGADLGLRLGRMARGAVALAYAIYLAAVLAVLLPPLWLLVLLAPSARTADRLVRSWSRAILRVAGCRLSLEGSEHLPIGEPAVLVANHASYVDAVVLLAALHKEFRFIAKRELVRTALIGAVLRRVGHLTVERVDLSQSVADAERATAALRDGMSLLFFPEGTFANAPGLLPFRLGAFKAAVETGRPVVPITICGTRDVLPGDRWLPHPGPIRVAIGPLLKPEASGWPEMVRLRDQARAEIAGRCGEPVLEGRPPLVGPG